MAGGFAIDLKGLLVLPALLVSGLILKENTEIMVSVKQGKQ